MTQIIFREAVPDVASECTQNRLDLYPAILMNSFLCWNARGVGNNSTTSHLKAICVLHNPFIEAILEPKISHDRLPALCSEIGMDHCMHGGDSNDHIWVCWREGIIFQNPVWSTQQVTSRIHCISTNKHYFLSFVYADCDVTVRDQLLDDLTTALDSINEPWIVTGDFNVISNWSEKSGGNNSDEGPLAAFNEFFLQAGLSDGGFKGNPFTWSNNQSGSGRIWERLDRSLLNGLVMSEFPMLQVTHLERIFSDHCPLLVDLAPAQHNSAFFHYQQVWESNAGFHATVSSCWEGCMHPDPLVNFGLKLKRLCIHLRMWNWEIFGDVRVKLCNMLLKVEVLEARLQRGWDSELANEVTLCKGQYQDIADLHQTMLKAKARVNWLDHGDHNSKLFHAALKSRRVQNKVHLELHDGTFSDDREVIGSAAASFYSDLFGVGCTEKEGKGSWHKMLPNMRMLRPTPEALRYLS
ncbi:hypothetical protein QQ045_014794 [Rhodiola kirilowii]